MRSVMAVLLPLFAAPCLAEAQSRSYVFGECLGHSTICDDQFNEVIILSVEEGGAISTDIRFSHPHIVEISAGKMTIDDSRFHSAHSIINNLGHEFTFEIAGHTEGPFAESVIIHLGEEQLASIKLVSITP